MVNFTTWHLDGPTSDNAKLDYEKEVEGIFVRFVKDSRLPLPLSEPVKKALRDRYVAYYSHNSTLDLQNALEAHLAVSRKLKIKAPPKGKLKGPSTKCFDRRLHIVDFVEDSLRRSGTLRPDWIRMVEEWNAIHPFDRANRDMLRVEYNRALREWSVVFQYLLMRHNDRPFREYLKRTSTGPRTTLTGTAALDWLRAHGGSFITVVEKTVVEKRKGGKK